MPMLNCVSSRLGILVVAFCILFPSISRADDEGVRNRIEAKTKTAMEDYDMMEFESAKTALLEAISLGERKDFKGPALATAYIYLGIVYFSGMGEKVEALESFERAVRINPSVKIGGGYSTPALLKLLATARGETGDAESETTSNTDDATTIEECPDEGLRHEIVEEASSGQAAELHVSVAESVETDEVAIFYRPEGKVTFTKVAMEKNGCHYKGSIPDTAVRGEVIHYYVAALNDGVEVEHRGSAGSPNIIEIERAGGGFDDDDPLSRGSGSLASSSSSKIFLSLAVGSGAGWIASGVTEKTKSPIESGGLVPALLHLTPEIGYMLNPQLLLSLAFRLGFPLGANVEGHANLGPAGLLRARYVLNESGEGLLFSGTLGAGILRNTLSFENGMAGMDTDTTAMGPILLGGGVGYTKKLGASLQLVAAFHTLAALHLGFDDVAGAKPENGVQFDANLAVLFAF